MMNLDETKKTYYAVAFLESENIRKKKMHMILTGQWSLNKCGKLGK